MNGSNAVECGGALAWAYETGGSVTSSPVQGSDGTVYVGSNDNVFYAVYPSGDPKWSYMTGEHIVASTALDSVGNVYIGSLDNQLYAFDSMGGFRWSYTHPGGAEEDEWSSAVIDATGLVYLQSGGNLYVFNSIGALVRSFIVNGGN